MDLHFDIYQQENNKGYLIEEWMKEFWGYGGILFVDKVVRTCKNQIDYIYSYLHVYFLS